MARGMGLAYALVLTVAVSGPGCVPDWAWTIEMDFEHGQTGDPAVGPDAFDELPDNIAQTEIVRGTSFSGAQAARMSVRGGDELFGGIKYFPTKLRHGQELWVRFRVYWPAGFDWSATPWLKFFRVHTRSHDVANEGYVDWYINNPQRSADPPFQIIKEIDDRWHLLGHDPQDDPKTGVWETYEMHYVFDTKPVSMGGRARVQAWKNGVLLSDIRDMRTLETEKSYAELFEFAYWNGGAPKDQSWFIDDVELTTVTPSDRDAAGNPMIGTAWTRPPQ
jgi:hypothetical protein